MNINTGIKQKAQRIVIYGVEGIGKSEMAAHFPTPLFIDTEGSTDHMNVARMDAPTSWAMLMDQVSFVASGQHNYKTLVIDTIDWAETMAARHICINGNVNGIEDFGFGKGYSYLAEEMGRFLDALSNVINRGVHVVLLGHSHLKRVELPEENGAFDKYELRLEKKVAPLPKEWADAVFFANYKYFLTGDSGGKKKATGGRRVIFTSHTTSYDGKNRYGLPAEIDFEGNPATLAQALVPFLPDFQTPTQEPIKQEATGAPIQEAPAQTPTTQQGESQTGQIQEEAPVGKGSTNFSGPLYDLMDLHQVTRQELEAMAARSGHMPEGMAMADFPQDYLDHLVGGWAEVHQSIINNRGQ